MLLSFPSPSAGRADDSDRITLAPEAIRQPDSWNPSQRQIVLGQIIDFDAEYLTLTNSEGEPQRLASRQVEAIAFHWETEDARSAAQLVEEQQYEAAIRKIVECRKAVPRWQDRILIAKMVMCFDALGYERQAGIFFLNLAAASPPPMLYADMPLCWTSKLPDAALKKAAQEWLASDDEHAQLLGASWLLAGEQRSAAAASIQKLKNSKNPTLATLASFQAQRLVPPPESEMKLTTWFASRDQLLEPLQLGPNAFLADRLRRMGKIELAIGQWSRIAATPHGRYHRATEALKEAAEQLKQLGRDAEAAQLLTWAQQFAPPTD